MQPRKKKLKPGQAGGLAVLKKYGPKHFSNMKLKYYRDLKKKNK